MSDFRKDGLVRQSPSWTEKASPPMPVDGRKPGRAVGPRLREGAEFVACRLTKPTVRLGLGR